MRVFPHGGLAQSPHSFEHDDASVLMVLSTRRDDRRAALRAGEASSAVLLAATNQGIVGPHVFPQLLLRLGWAQPGCADLPPTPRRHLEHVLLPNR